MGIITKKIYFSSVKSYAIASLSTALWLGAESVDAQTSNQSRRMAVQDTSRENRQSRRLLYSRWDDRPSNRFNYVPPRSSLFLREPKSLTNEFRLDTNRRMSVYERIGDPQYKRTFRV